MVDLITSLKTRRKPGRDGLISACPRVSRIQLSPASTYRRINYPWMRVYYSICESTQSSTCLNEKKYRVCTNPSIQQCCPWIHTQACPQIHNPTRHRTERMCIEIRRASHDRLFHERQHVRQQDRPPVLAAVLFREQVRDQDGPLIAQVLQVVGIPFVRGDVIPCKKGQVRRRVR